jgi:hypothetical protein
MQMWSAAPDNTAQPRRFSTRDLIFGLSGVALGAAIMGGVWGITAAVGSGSDKPSSHTAETFQSAVNECELDDASGVLLDHNSVTFSATGEYLGADMDDVECTLDALNAHTSTLSKINQTRALDGRQDDHWGGFEASWTYHPDDGLNLVVEIQDAPAN